jgi:hypothetical protein
MLKEFKGFGLNSLEGAFGDLVAWRHGEVVGVGRSKRDKHQKQTPIVRNIPSNQKS